MGLESVPKIDFEKVYSLGYTMAARLAALTSKLKDLEMVPMVASLVALKGPEMVALKGPEMAPLKKWTERRMGNHLFPLVWVMLMLKPL